MKKLVLLLTLMVSTVSMAQDFEIEAQRFPYYDILEWKGQGALLMSKDPGSTTRKINVTLVGNQESSIWDEAFTPKGDEFYYIASENARYVYFMDNLDLLNGKIYFTQFNEAGNKKTLNVSYIPALKNVGISNWNDVELINIVVTDKALVHHFRYHDKKGKSIKEIATFMTHHNQLVFSAELGVIPDDHLKKEDVGLWDYIGFTGEKICFAARDIKNKEKGWSIKEFSPKGKYTSDFFIKAPSDFIAVENIGFGTTGKYYLDDKTTVDKGLVTFINDKFYMVGGKSSNNSAELVLYEREGKDWIEINSMKLSYFIPKKALKLGLYPLNEGIAYHLDHNGYNKASIITFDKEESYSHNAFTDRSIYNPSSVFNWKEKDEFSVQLPGKVVLTFNINQLNKEGNVKFTLHK